MLSETICSLYLDVQIYVYLLNYASFLKGNETFFGFFSFFSYLCHIMVGLFKLNKDEAISIKHEADEMLRGLYRFNGVWDMEPCPIWVDNKNIRWDVRFHDDPEWSYMFTRMDYLYKFILATEITDDLKYIRHGLSIIDKWYKDHWFYLGSKRGKIVSILLKRTSLGYRTIDVAIMLSNMTDFLLYCLEKGFLSQTAFTRYQRRVQEGMRYVISHSDEGQKPFSNWGIIENANVLYCILRLNYRKYGADVKSRLVRQVYNQILPDGSQIESSPMYLAQILLALLKIMNLPNCEICQELRKPVLAGCNYIMNVRKLNNCIPNIGDSDITEISDLMMIASHVLHIDNFIDAVNREITLEYAFKYKIQRQFRGNVVSPSDDIFVKLRYQTVFRSEAKGVYLLCSNIPRVVDGHKHYDYMSILYSEYGKDVLVDLGRYSYKDDDNRQFMKGPSGHNTICFPDHPFYEHVTSWVTCQRIECFDNVAGMDKDIRVTMRCLFGYSEVEVSRAVTYSLVDGLQIKDDIHHDVGGELLYETFFNIGPDFSLTQEQGVVCLHDDFGHFLYYHNNLSLPVEIRQVQYSVCYNNIQTINQIVVRSKQSSITHFFSKNNLMYGIQ